MISSALRYNYISSLHRGNRPLMQIACYEYMDLLESMYPQHKVKICPSETVAFRLPKLRE